MLKCTQSVTISVKFPQFTPIVEEAGGWKDYPQYGQVFLNQSLSLHIPELYLTLDYDESLLPYLDRYWKIAKDS